LYSVFSIPGYFCLCGYVLQHYISKTSNRKLTKSIWNQLRTNGTITTFVKAHQSLKDSYLRLREEKFAGVRDEFEDLLRNRDPTFSFDIDSESCTVLCNHGFMSPVDLREEIFQLGPPIIIETFGYLIFPKRETPKMQVPFKENKIDVVELIAILLPYFDKEKMKNAIENSHKKTEVTFFRPKKKRDKVPKEPNYVFEAFGILRSWLPKSYQITSETNCQGKYADVHITHKDASGIMLEFISNERFRKKEKTHEAESSVIGHILRSEGYGRDLGAEPWVLHFVAVCTFPENPKDVEWYNSVSVNCMYIYHDDNFETFKLFIKYSGLNTSPFEWKMKE
jgi:hypothetical protein